MADIADIDMSTLPPGATVQRIGDGVIVRAENGKFMPGTVSPKMITRENAREMSVLRQEAVKRKIRDEIVKRTPGITSSTAAVALAAGDLWEQIVQNKDANARYRLEAWQAIGRQADLLTDNRQAAPQNDGLTVSIGADIARDIVSRLMGRRDGSG